MNRTRESRFVTVAWIAYGMTQQVLPPYTYPKSPHHITLPQLAAVVWLAQPDLEVNQSRAKTICLTDIVLSVMLA